MHVFPEKTACHREPGDNHIPQRLRKIQTRACRQRDQTAAATAARQAMIDATRASAIYLEAAQTRLFLASLLDPQRPNDARILRAFEQLANAADNVGAMLTRAALAGAPDVLSARAEGP